MDDTYTQEQSLYLGSLGSSGTKSDTDILDIVASGDGASRKRICEHFANQLSTNGLLNMVDLKLDEKLARHSELFFTALVVAESEHGDSVKNQRLCWFRFVADRLLKVMEVHQVACSKDYQVPGYKPQLLVLGETISVLVQALEDQPDADFNLPLPSKRILCMAASRMLAVVQLMYGNAKGWGREILPLYVTDGLCDIVDHLYEAFYNHDNVEWQGSVCRLVSCDCQPIVKAG